MSCASDRCPHPVRSIYQNPHRRIDGYLGTRLKRHIVELFNVAVLVLGRQKELGNLPWLYLENNVSFGMLVSMQTQQSSLGYK